MSKSDTALFPCHRNNILREIRSSRSYSSVSASTKFERVTPTVHAVPFAKWSRKLYGSDKALSDEHKRQMNSAKFVIHPYSNFRLAWDVASAILIFANIMFIPMDIAFSGDIEDARCIIFKIISDTWFIVDVVLNFRTGVCEYGADRTKITLDPQKIARIYLRGWFTVDVIAATPIDFIIRLFIDSKGSKAVRFIRIVKAVSLIRIARVPRLIRGLHQWEEVFNLQYDFAVSVLRFAYLIFFILLTCHFSGCLQYMIPMFYDFPEDTWVKMRGLDHPNVTWWEAYSWSVFKSTSHMLCIGYSQIIPDGLIDLWTTMFSQIIGAIIFAVFIGNAINLMEEMDATKNAYKMKMNQIHEYLGFRRVPAGLRKRVIDFCEMRFQGKLFDEQQILKELNNVLRREVVTFNTAGLIHSVPLFEDIGDDFVFEMGCKLKYAVYLRDETIVREGDLADNMFFISHGEVDIRSRTFSNILSDGAHFGEAALVSTEMRRTADVVALTNVHTYSLHRSQYLDLLRRFPEDAHKIYDCARRINARSSRYDFMRKYFPGSDD